MTGILIVFPKAEDGKSIRNLLVRHGYDVAAVCTLGSQVLNDMDMMNSGIIISGYRYPDMHYMELKESLPPGSTCCFWRLPGCVRNARIRISSV